ncbi:MAG: protease complex subunit PrcB family protein, partial [Planctomycetota bacterium]
SNGGYTATITKVEVDGANITVHVRENQPGPTCVVPEVTTSPYHIIRMPRVDGTAQQKLTVNVVNCP